MSSDSKTPIIIIIINHHPLIANRNIQNVTHYRVVMYGQYVSVHTLMQLVKMMYQHAYTHAHR